MGTYTPDKVLVSTGIDEVGLNLGLPRLESETMSAYRDRVLEEIRDPAGATENDFIKSVSRQVGLKDIPVFEIDLLKDANGDPLAADPFIEVTYTHFRAYHDHENNLIDIEINLTDRTTGYFLREVQTALAGSTYFSPTTLDPDFTYKKSINLRFGNSEKVLFSETLSLSRAHKLAKPYIKDIRFTAFELFQNEVANKDLIVEEGDFSIDYSEGMIWTKETLRGFATYSFRDFPYILYWQPVRVVPLNGSDREYLYRDTIISDSTGLESYEKINSQGAEILNIVLEAGPLGWGE
jgi:hypothetical protein